MPTTVEPTTTGAVAGEVAVRILETASTTQPPARGNEAKACVIAFSGSNELNDWIRNLNSLPMGHFCGEPHWHAGFVYEMNDVLNNPSWKTFRDYLKGCTRVVSVGHSLGGALATMFAYCANSKSKHRPVAFEGIHAEVELYTAGAPRTKLQAPQNGRAEDTAFKGVRFWSYSSSMCIFQFCRNWCCIPSGWLFPYQGDPVPSVPPGFQHPVELAVGMDTIHQEVVIDGALSKEVFMQPSLGSIDDWWMHDQLFYYNLGRDYLAGLPPSMRSMWW